MKLFQNKNLITVVVCTHNRAALLEKCLKALCQQKGNLPYKILVIDNNSNDQTATVIERYKKTNGIQSLFVKKIGQNICRNLGWKTANSKYVAYTDDDVIVKNDWIKEIYSFIKRHPEADMFGGPYVFYSDKPIPKWFPREAKQDSLGQKEKKLLPGDGYLNGTSMVISRKILQKFKGFNTQFGPIGRGKINYGGETELQYRLRKGGANMYYNPKMAVKHYLDPNKLTLQSLLYSFFKYGRGSSPFSGGESSVLFKTVFVFLRSLVYAGFVMLFESHPYLKRKIYYAVRESVTILGSFFPYKNVNLSIIGLILTYQTI